MSATTLPRLPRLPRDLVGGGTGIAVRLPLEPGAIAHKVARDVVKHEGFPAWTEHVVVPACALDEDPCREFTASWADHMGVQACTEPACFPDAEPR